ncbi:MAG: serine hydrolase [Sphingopyxis sp.]|nr:MAG: serine hydrolase [Sphingopyxis sp.]
MVMVTEINKSEIASNQASDTSVRNAYMEVARMIRLCAALMTLLTLATPAQAETLDLARLETILASGKLGKVTSVIVEQGGIIKYEKYFGKGGPEVRNDIRSAAKSITALAIGQAIGDGTIDSVDDRPWALLMPQANGPKGEITLRDLLTMSSALDCNDWTPKSPGNEEKMYPKRVWRDFALQIPVAKDYVRDTKGFGRFSYCTAGAFLLGQYLQERSGIRFDHFVEQRLFAPLGIGAVKWKRSPSGEVQSGGQLEIRARDLVPLGRLVLNGGIYEGTRLVPAAWIDEMLIPHVRATGIDDYGYLWWLRAFRSAERSVTGWYMSGNGGNKVVILPELDAVIVMTATN